MEITAFDEFTICVALLVAGLIFVDWLLGETKRARMREHLGEWWLMVEETNFEGFLPPHAEKIRRRFESLLGNRGWLSIRFFLFAAFASAILTAITVVFFLLKADWIVYDSILFSSLLAEEPIQAFLSFYLNLVAQNILLFWVSLGITLFFLRLMERSNKWYRLLGLLFADLIFIVILAIGTVLISALLVQHIIKPLGLPSPFDYLIEPKKFTSLEQLFQYRESWGTLVGVLIWAALLSGILPMVPHLGILFLFLSSKLLRPILKPVICQILYAFYDSKKGVLTSIAVAVGTLAKIIQIMVRTYSK